TAANEHERPRNQAEAGRQTHLTAQQNAATLASQFQASRTRLATSQHATANRERQLSELSASEAKLAEALAAAREPEKTASEQLAAQAEQVEAAENELTESRNLHASRANDLAQLHGRQQGVAERAEVLEEFERTLEGVGAGVKEVLERAGIKAQRTGDREQGTGGDVGYPWSLVKGVVADFVQVSVAH